MVLRALTPVPWQPADRQQSGASDTSGQPALVLIAQDAASITALTALRNDLPVGSDLPATAPAERQAARSLLQLGWMGMMGADGSARGAARDFFPADGFQYGETNQGGPKVTGGFEVSLSHTSGRDGAPPAVALAITRSGAIGVDLERLRALDFNPTWRAALKAVGDGRELVGWTRLEALGKANGRGIGWVLERLRALGTISDTDDQDSWALHVRNRFRADVSVGGLALWTLKGDLDLVVTVATSAGAPAPFCLLIDPDWCAQWQQRLRVSGKALD